MEKWDDNVTNIFFLKLSLITVFDEKNMLKTIKSKISKIIIVYSFWGFIIKTKQDISKNVSITFKLSDAKRN